MIVAAADEKVYSLGFVGVVTDGCSEGEVAKAHHSSFYEVDEVDEGNILRRATD